QSPTVSIKHLLAKPSGRRSWATPPPSRRFIDSNAGRVYALCLRMVRDSIEAEDLTQEAFMQVFRKLKTFRGDSAFSTWLHRLTFNIVLMRLRKKSPPIVSIDATADQADEADSPAIDVGVPDLLLEGSIDRMRLEHCIK